MKRSAKVILAAFMALMLALMAACGSNQQSGGNAGDNGGQTGGTSEPANNNEQKVEEVLLGAVVPLTGANASWGQQTWNGFQLAAKIINEQGGIQSLGGAKIKTIVGDTETQPTVAGTQTEKLIKQGVSALIGTNQSAATLVATQVAERNEVPFVISADVAPLITERGFKYTFRTAALVGHNMRDVLTWAKETGEKHGKPATRVAFLSENSEVGLAANKAGVEIAKELGFEVVEDVAFDPNTQNFTEYLSKIQAKDAQIIVGYQNPSQAILITRAMQTLKYNPMVFAGVQGGTATKEYVETLGADANYVVASSTWSSDLDIPGMKEIAQRFKEETGNEFDATAAAGFTSMAVIWEGLEKAGSADPKKLRDAIASIELKTGERNFMLLRGVKFNEKGDNDWAGGVVMMIKDGKWISIYPSEYTSVEYPWPKPEWGTP